MERCLSEAQKERAKFCLANIKDKLVAIEQELHLENADKHYIGEKIESVYWDTKCIKSMCEEISDGE